jgi:hypothetical protein
MDRRLCLRRAWISLFLCFLCVATVLVAESRNPSDYPLRIHIFSRDQTTFYWRRETDEAKGDGRANLFADGEARGVDFSYECQDKLRSSFGYETYPAKWKKPGRELTVLFPKFGQTGAYWTCNLKTDVKDFAYTRHNSGMGSESIAEFKDWMVRHNYDPEHGKDQPTRTPPPPQ